jgi:hypothetical protein
MPPHRYIDTATITYTDGTTEEIVGNYESVHDGVLTICTASSYGPFRDVHKIVLANVRSWVWEKGS